MNKTSLIFEINEIGETKLGFISVFENFTDKLFEFKRAYWKYNLPSQVVRGGLAHYELEQDIILPFETDRIYS